MAQFDEVGKNAGVDAKKQYMVVSLGGVNIVAFKGPNDFKIGPARKLEISEITHKTYAGALHAMQAQFAKWKLEASHSAVDYIKKMHGQLPSSSRLLLVKGTARGETQIEAVSGKSSVKLRVSVVPAKTKQFTVAFRFVELYNDAGKTQKTQWDESGKRDLLNILNWTFGPQANVFFQLADAASIRVNVEKVSLDTPINGDAFRKYVLPQKNKSASVTVFFVEKYESGGKRDGFSENFVGEAACVVEDNPPNVLTDGDPFEVTLAHEVCHFLQNDQQPSEASKFDGHHDREGILMANGKESARIDEDLMRRINVP